MATRVEYRVKRKLGGIVYESHPMTEREAKYLAADPKTVVVQERSVTESPWTLCKRFEKDVTDAE